MTSNQWRPITSAGQSFVFPGGAQDRHTQEIFDRSPPLRQQPVPFPVSQNQTTMINDGTRVFSNSIHGSSIPTIPAMSASQLSKPDTIMPLNRIDHPLGPPRNQYTGGLMKGDTMEGGGRTGFVDASISTVPQTAGCYQFVDDGSRSHLSRAPGLMLPGYVSNINDGNNGGLSGRTPTTAIGGTTTATALATSGIGGLASLNDPILTCRECGLKFQNPSTFEQHECRGFIVRKEIKKNLTCDQCHAELKNERNLKRHMSVVHGTRHPFPCPNCTASFSARGSLKIHQRNVHGLQDNYYQPNHSNNHANDSTNRRLRIGGPTKKIEKTYSCPLCPDTFKWKGNLKRHRLLVHERIRPYTCNICKAKFGTKSNMRVHLMTHEKLL